MDDHMSSNMKELCASLSLVLNLKVYTELFTTVFPTLSLTLVLHDALLNSIFRYNWFSANIERGPQYPSKVTKTASFSYISSKLNSIPENSAIFMSDIHF